MSAKKGAIMRNNSIKEIHKETGNRIRKCRKEMNPKVSQKVLAEYLHVPDDTISRIENGKYAKLNYDQIYAIAGFLDVDFYYLTCTTNTCSKFVSLAHKATDSESSFAIHTFLSKYGQFQNDILQLATANICHERLQHLLEAFHLEVTKCLTQEYPLAPTEIMHYLYEKGQLSYPPDYVALSEDDFFIFY